MSTLGRWSTSSAPPVCPWSAALAAVAMRSWSATPLTPQMWLCSCWKSNQQERIRNMLKWLLWSTRHVNVDPEIYRRMEGGGQEEEVGRERKDREWRTVTSVSLLAGNCSHASVATWFPIYSPFSANSIDSLLSTFRILSTRCAGDTSARVTAVMRPAPAWGTVATVEPPESHSQQGGRASSHLTWQGGAAQWKPTLTGGDW